jgi:hypothetical protein
MANKIQFKRSSVAGKQPNTTNLSVGELALNIADGKIYSSNGSDIFEPAGNVSSLYIGNSSVYSFANSTDLSTNTLHITNKINIGNAGGFDFGNLAVIEIDASQNTYLQTIIQNANTGNNASGDLVVTTDNGNDSFGYVDLGINSSTYDRSEFSIAGAGVAYLYASDSDLTIGTAKAKELVFHANGTTSSDRKFTINATAITIADNVGLSVNGSIGSANQILTSNGSGVYWATPDTGGSAAITIRTTDGNGGGVNTTVVATTLNIDESANILHLISQGGNSAYLYANLSGYATTGSVTSNATTAYTNAVSYIDGKISTANSAITGNAATAYSNAVSYIDGKISTANSAITGNAATAYSNATNFASNASNISTGTLSYSVIPSNIVNTTSAFTFSNNLIFNGNVTVNNSLKDYSGNSGSFGQYLSSGSNHKPVWVSPFYYSTAMYDFTSYGLGWTNIAPNQNSSTLEFRTDVPIPHGAIWMYIYNDGLIDSHPITIDSPHNIQTPMMWITIDGSGVYDAALNPDGKDYWFNITPPPAGA